MKKLTSSKFPLLLRRGTALAGGWFFALALVFAFSLPSCLTVRRIERNCDKFAKVCVTETVVETVYRDTTIFRTDTIRVPLPFRDTVKITDTVRIFNNLAYLPTVRKQFGLIGVDAGVNHSILRVNAWLTDSTILHPLRDTIIINDAISNSTTTNTITLPPEKYVPKFYKFTFWIFIIQLALLAIWTIIKFKAGNLIDKLLPRRKV